MLDDGDVGKEICLHKGDIVCLKLEARLATGFSWKVSKIDSERLKLISESTEKNNDDEASIEYQLFNFEAMSKGKFELELLYRRPWETDKPPAKKYFITMKIK